MNGYIKIRVMADGRYFDCWQQIENGFVIGHVDDAGAAATMPEPHESIVLNKTLHFLPNVVDKPEAKPTPAAIESDVSPAGDEK